MLEDLGLVNRLLDLSLFNVLHNHSFFLELVNDGLADDLLTCAEVMGLSTLHAVGVHGSVSDHALGVASGKTSLMTGKSGGGVLLVHSADHSAAG